MKKLPILIISTIIISQFISCKKHTEVNLQEFDRYFEKMVEDWNVPGASIGIVKDGKIVFKGNYGTLEVGKNDKPNENTLYAIASNSKAFTTTIISMLVQEKKLKWSDKVKSYLPYFELYDPWVSKETTIEDILCHRTGLGSQSGDILWYKSNLSTEEIIKRAKHLPKAYDFRTGFAYSNLMYIVAGEIIEKVTEKSWSQNVKEKILIPLKMDRTFTSTKILSEQGNFASPHKYHDKKNIPVKWDDWEDVAAMGGMISNVEDISKWMIFLLNQGIIEEDTLLTKENLNKLWTPHNNFSIDHSSENKFKKHFESYGLGWKLSNYYDKLMVSHTGGYTGMVSIITLIPKDNLGVVVLTNGMKSPIRAALYYILDTFIQGKSKDWSTEILNKRNTDFHINDSIISASKADRVLDTEPSFSIDEYTGTYYSDVYGNIYISKKGENLHLELEHSPELSAELKYWDFDTWEIIWENQQCWLSFAKLKFIKKKNKISRIIFDFRRTNTLFDPLKKNKKIQ